LEDKRQESTTGIMEFRRQTFLAYTMPYFTGGDRLEIVHRRYSHLGDGVFGIIKGVIINPLTFISNILTKEKLSYLLMLLLPVFFLPLLSLSVFLLALPSLMINLLSSYSMTHYPFMYYHTAPILSFIFISTIFSLHRLEKYINKSLVSFPFILVFIPSLMFSIAFSPAPYSLVSSSREFVVDDHARKIDEIKEMIPGKASLSVQNNLGAHFSHRENVYTFPFLSDKTEYVLLDVTDPYKIIRFYPRQRNFMFITQLGLEEYFNESLGVFENMNYKIIYEEDGYYLFKKEDSVNVIPGQSINSFKERLDLLKERYEH
jgi:uncharacterized membrane protein